MNDRFKDTLVRIRRSHNPKLSIEGFLLTMFDERFNQEALRIAHKLGLDRIVACMKLGYETPLGEGAMGLAADPGFGLAGNDTGREARRPPPFIQVRRDREAGSKNRKDPSTSW